MESSPLDLLRGAMLYDNILVEPIVIGNSGVVLKPQNYEDKPEFGKVVSVGEGRLLENGTIVESRVKEGDTIFFQKYSAQKVRVQGKDYLIIREEDIYWKAGKKK